MFTEKIMMVGVLALFPTLLSADNLNEETVMKNNIVQVEIDNESNRDEWRITNDGVMGGLSVGKVHLDNKKFIFSGDISTENNGGFTSVFKRLPALQKNINAVSLRVTGDGKSYQLRMRNQVMGYDLAYKMVFETKEGEVATHTFNLADFSASFRGRVIGNAPTLEAETISHVGFLITTKQPQTFSLSVHSIEFYQRSDL
jgi:hypothetical protein